VREAIPDIFHVITWWNDGDDDDHTKSEIELGKKSFVWM